MFALIEQIRIKLLWLSKNLMATELENIDGLVQERCNSSGLAMELRLSCTNPSIWAN